ncbi:MAG: iron-containing alcohol dehydrogenase [Burkholderiales bacterium]|nr:iron-containing alcohol dehydrogenase [Burkholderiales bacterium]
MILSGSFNFPPIERVIYGIPAAEALLEEVNRLGTRRIFLLVSRTMNRTTDEVTKVRTALGDRFAGLHDQMPPHSPRDAVIEAASRARDVGTDLLVTFGGGSLTDAGKVIQICLRHDIREMDQLEPFRMVTNPDGTRKVPEYEGPIVRQIAIPTTLSGGEFNAQAGCTDPRIRVKQSYRHPGLVPRTTIYDPIPTVHTPLGTWLATGVRAIDHCVEGICAKHHNPVNDGYALHGLRLLAQHLPRVKHEPACLEARQQCQMAIWLAMGASSHLGVVKGISHAIGHVLGGTCNVPHGVTSCITMPAALRYNKPANHERQRLVAEAMGSPGADAADLLEAFITDLGMPTRLSAVGVTREQFPIIAANTMRDYYTHSNPRSITSSEQIEEVLESIA